MDYEPAADGFPWRGPVKRQTIARSHDERCVLQRVLLRLADRPGPPSLLGDFVNRVAGAAGAGPRAAEPRLARYVRNA
ncbi:hypothetical protein San01_60790 [Streptomyces angustmyceticus]|uniref:Uncharacterized protein n=1 Tax=Streptomyces angustmyceticus TaxID=285578 RepID=A0A5J4LNK7_9ACTN|nr:hypothetical protein San01_60790 [Streptomyces angustmyceticus]